MSLTSRSELLAGWGCYAPSHADVARPERRHEIAEAVRTIHDHGKDVIARGSGLAYGDAASNAGGCVIAMARLNRFLSFDEEQGLVTCESGVTIGEILDVGVPRGWFLHVMPGTARATVGGCVACDVHGKNHHIAGSFAQYVTGMTLLTGNGDVIACNPTENTELFWATCGGMGLTGIILDLTLQLRRIETDSIVARNILARDLEETFRKLEETAAATYSVAWLDGAHRRASIGRGVVMLSEHAWLSDLASERQSTPLAPKAPSPRSLPFGLPFGVLGWPPVVSMLNDAIYRRYASTGEQAMLVDANTFFFPLDMLDNWNRLFGPRGFFEYQVMLPAPKAFDAIRQMLDQLREARLASSFTSIKRLGPQSQGHLSFPAPGYAFSFDLAAAGSHVLSLLDRCDELTIAAGGRVYLAKDARLSAGAFAAMYPRRDEWRAIARRYDPDCVFASSMSRRLELTS